MDPARSENHGMHGTSLGAVLGVQSPELLLSVDTPSSSATMQLTPSDGVAAWACQVHPPVFTQAGTPCVQAGVHTCTKLGEASPGTVAFAS